MTMLVPDRTGSVAARAGSSLLGRLRPITGFEEELIAAHADTSNTASLCNELLARCLVPPGCDPGPVRDEVARLLVAERDRALIVLRLRSFGDRVESEVTCPSCGGTSEITFALSDLPLAAVEPPREVVVQHDGHVITARLPTAADQEQVLAEPSASAAERRTVLLARVVERIDDRAGPMSADDVRALPSAVRMAVEHALEAAAPDVDLSMDVQCCRCPSAFEAPFDLRAFFLPS